MKNHLNEEQNIANNPSTVASQVEPQPRKKTMSAAALAPNRASNAFAIKTKVIEVFDNFFCGKKLRNETNCAQGRLFCAA